MNRDKAMDTGAADTGLAEPPPRRGLLRHHLIRTISLAVPVMIARSGALIMITADVIMTGRAGAGELAFYGLGYAPAQALFVTGMGFLLGTMVLTAQARGRGRNSTCGTIWVVGMAHALTAGLVFWLVTLAGERFKVGHR